MKTMFKSLLTLVAVAALTAPAFAKESKRCEEKKPSICDNKCCPITNGEIVIGTDVGDSPDFERFESFLPSDQEDPTTIQNAQTQLLGYDVKVACRIAEILSQKCCKKITVSFRDITFPQLIPTLESGDIDMLMASQNRNALRLQRICQIPYGSQTSSIRCFSLIYNTTNAKVSGVLDNNLSLEDCETGQKDALGDLDTSGMGTIELATQDGTTFQIYLQALGVPNAGAAQVGCTGKPDGMGAPTYQNINYNSVTDSFAGLQEVEAKTKDVLMWDPNALDLSGFMNLKEAFTWIVCEEARPAAFSIGINKNCCEFAELIQDIIKNLSDSGFLQRCWEQEVGGQWIAPTTLALAPCFDGFRPCDNENTPQLRCSNPLAKVCADPCASKKACKPCVKH